MLIYREWLSEDGKTIAKHTLKEWFDMLNIKPVKVGGYNMYSTTEKQYAYNGYVDIYNEHSRGLYHHEIDSYMNTLFYADNADIKMLDLKVWEG